jgi:transcriptional regulator with XRE-family HTH domain
MVEKKYIDLKEKPIQSIVRRFMDKGGMTQEVFADKLNQNLINSSVSRPAVSYWLNGKNEPDMKLLFECLAIYSDWRAEFARDCLMSMWQDLFLNGIVRIELPKAE